MQRTLPNVGFGVRDGTPHPGTLWVPDTNAVVTIGSELIIKHIQNA
ncbi:MAG: hypothetical protein HY897_07975 [Deltaproteobacteria bacterium]|nr:hypothetical protein [Deltaproteobacteria bacterium]